MVTIPQVTKFCIACATDKPVTDYYVVRGRLGGWCKECQKAASRRQASSGYFRQRRADGKEKPRVKRLENWTAAKFLRDARASSRRRGLPPPTVTEEFVCRLVSEFKASNHCVLERGHPFSPSLDRIHSGRGYDTDNVKVCWLIENLAKNSWSEDVVVEFAKRKLGIPV